MMGAAPVGNRLSLGLPRSRNAGGDDQHCGRQGRCYESWRAWVSLWHRLLGTPVYTRGSQEFLDCLSSGAWVEEPGLF